MADLKSKLSRLSGAGMGPSKPRPPIVSTLPVPTDNPRLAELRARLQGMRARGVRRVRNAIPDVPLPGELFDTDAGPVHRIAQAYLAEHCHGTTPLAWCLDATAQHIAQLAVDTKLTDVDMQRLLFLDTETTGLAGGTGTVAFLVGLAWFDNGALQVEQLLLRHFGDEAAMLERLVHHLDRASCIVTYNGKSFDWPLLKSRFILHRRTPPVLPHLDVLHCARRVFGRRNGPMRLTGVESDILGFVRQHDIDGADIPATYFAFLRGAARHTLTPVVTHNAHDLLALVATLGTLARRLEAPAASTDGRDHLALAELSARLGKSDRALSFAQAAVDAACGAAVSRAALALSARLVKGQGDAGAAASLLQEALVHGGADPVERGRLHLALTKLYEHQLRDVPQALSHAAHTAACEGAPRHAARLARLSRKMERLP